MQLSCGLLCVPRCEPGLDWNTQEAHPHGGGGGVQDPAGVPGVPLGDMFCSWGTYVGREQGRARRGVQPTAYPKVLGGAPRTPRRAERRPLPTKVAEWPEPRSHLGAFPREAILDEAFAGPPVTKLAVQKKMTTEMVRLTRAQLLSCETRADQCHRAQDEGVAIRRGIRLEAVLPAASDYINQNGLADMHGQAAFEAELG